MDIMWVSVSERTREIGIRKAIGATNKQILNQFLVEGSLLSIVGGIIGIITSLIINGLLRLYTGLHPAITIPIMILAVAISIGVGIIFSVAPALKAARKNPIDALRGE
jgi:putative ABC transport system permease protein